MAIKMHAFYRLGSILFVSNALNVLQVAKTICSCLYIMALEFANFEKSLVQVTNRHWVVVENSIFVLFQYVLNRPIPSGTALHKMGNSRDEIRWYAI